MNYEELKEKYDARRVAIALVEAIEKVEEFDNIDDYIILISRPAMHYLLTEAENYVIRTEQLHYFMGVPIWISRILPEDIDFVLMRKKEANPIIAAEKEWRSWMQ